MIVLVWEPYNYNWKTYDIHHPTQQMTPEHNKMLLSECVIRFKFIRSKVLILQTEVVKWILSLPLWNRT